MNELSGELRESEELLTGFDELLRQKRMAQVKVRFSNSWREFGELLDCFSRLPEPVQRQPPILLEIAGFPHYENVCSNILEFFFDPRNKEHGLHDAVLKSLLEAAKSELVHADLASVNRVEREDTTTSGKRIDLEIEGESFVIGIENKIFAPLTNDLPDYDLHLKKRAGAGSSPKKVEEILLCLAREGFKGTTSEALRS